MNSWNDRFERRSSGSREPVGLEEKSEPLPTGAVINMTEVNGGEMGRVQACPNLAEISVTSDGEEVLPTLQGHCSFARSEGYKCFCGARVGQGKHPKGLTPGCALQHAFVKRTTGGISDFGRVEIVE